jgi:hypothetical protein
MLEDKSETTFQLSRDKAQKCHRISPGVAIPPSALRLRLTLRSLALRLQQRHFFQWIEVGAKGPGAVGTVARKSLGV